MNRLRDDDDEKEGENEKKESAEPLCGWKGGREGGREGRMGKMHARVVGQGECCPQADSKCQGVIFVCLSILPLRKSTTTQTTCPVVGALLWVKRKQQGRRMVARLFLQASSYSETPRKRLGQKSCGRSIGRPSPALWRVECPVGEANDRANKCAAAAAARDYLAPPRIAFVRMNSLRSPSWG